MRHASHHLHVVFLSTGGSAVAFAILVPSLVANLNESHTSTLLIALVSSIWALPSVIGGPIFTRAIARYDPRTSLLIGQLSYCIILLVFPVCRNVWVWIFLQLLGGVVLGHFYLVMEAWLIHFSGESLRGRLAAIYGIVPAVGYALGVGIYSVLDFHGFGPFLAAALAVTVGSLPLILLRGTAGEAIVGGEVRLRATARVVPLLLVIGAIAGMFQTLGWGVFQVYASSKGFAPRSVGWLLFCFFLGQILLTYPIGWLADGVGRRALFMCIGWTASALMLVLHVWGHTAALWVVVFIMGGMFCSVYTLGLAIIGQCFESKDLSSAAASFLTAYSVGAVAGPPLVGALMDCIGETELPLILAVPAVTIALCAGAARTEWTPAPVRSDVDKF